MPVRLQTLSGNEEESSKSRQEPGMFKEVVPIPERNENENDDTISIRQWRARPA